MTKHVLTPLREKFDRKWIPEPNSGCWLWTGCVVQTSKSGIQAGLRPWIGRGRVTEGVELAYRISWELFRGEIPDGLEVCHTCDVPICVNPDHLFIGTHADNMADMGRKGRNRVRANMATSSYNRKLTEDDVRLIRSSQMNNAELGRLIGVQKETVRAVRLRLTWRHIQ